MRHIITSITLPEVFEKVRQFNTVDEKAQHLSLYKTRTLAWFINALYNVDYTPLKEFVPEDLKFNFRDPEICNMTLQNAINRLDASLKYLKAGNSRVAGRNVPIILEEISAEEAKLLIKVFNGERTIDGVSKSVFKRVYPDFFPQSTNSTKPS